MGPGPEAAADGWGSQRDRSSCSSSWPPRAPAKAAAKARADEEADAELALQELELELELRSAGCGGGQDRLISEVPWVG